MKQNKLLRAARLTMLVATAAASMAGTQLANAADIPNKTLVYCSEGSPAGFDPAQYTTGVDFTANTFTVYNRLVEFERGGTKVEPCSIGIAAARATEAPSAAVREMQRDEAYWGVRMAGL